MNIKYKFSCFEAKSWRLSSGETSSGGIGLKALGIVGICEGLNFTNRLGVDDILQKWLKVKRNEFTRRRA
jgi:hypothetical protein